MPDGGWGGAAFLTSFSRMFGKEHRLKQAFELFTRFYK